MNTQELSVSCFPLTPLYHIAVMFDWGVSLWTQSNNEHRELSAWHSPWTPRYHGDGTDGTVMGFQLTKSNNERSRIEYLA